MIKNWTLNDSLKFIGNLCFNQAFGSEGKLEKAEPASEPSRKIGIKPSQLPSWAGKSEKTEPASKPSRAKITQAMSQAKSNACFKFCLRVETMN
jgi:hypothetical protein